MPSMTTNYKARGSLTAFRQTAGSVTMVFITATFLPLVARIGKGNDAAGYFWTIAIFFAITVPLFIICVFGTKERVIPPAETAKVPIKESFKCFKGNVPAILLAVAYFTWGLGGGISGSARMYFCTYVVGSSSYFTVNMTFMSFGGALGGVILGLLNRRNKS